MRLCHVVGCGVGGRADSPSPNTRLKRGRSGGVGEGGDGSAGWWGRGDTTSVSLAAAVGTLVGGSSGPRRFTMVTENAGEPCAEAGEVLWAESPGALGES